MANFSELPTEIQLLITQDLPRSDLFQLKSLNSLFLSQWMDTRWRFVKVELINPKRAVRLLRRIVDPFVATRLEFLTIDLDQKERPSSPRRTISKPQKPGSQTFDGAVTVLLDSLPLLPNITCLTIQAFENFTFDVTPFFQRISSLSSARRLQTLSLLGFVGMLTSLRECSAHNTPFESLTKLNLYLRDDPVMETKFILSLEQFLRSLAPTLQWLYISTAIDLSPLFNALSQPLSLSQSHSSVPFPNLTSVFLRLHFNTSLQPDPRSLRLFLLTHSNLQHLHLRTHSIIPKTEESLAALLNELVNNNDRLPSLQTLDVYPSASQTGLSALLTLIKRSTPTLTSLVIPTRYLTDEEVNQVVDAVTEDGVRGMTTTTTREEPRKLKSLEMSISCLSVPLLDLLARKLPQLESLCLRVNNIIGSDEYSFYEQLSQRWYDPNITCHSQDILHAWNLQNISIYWNWENRIQSERAEIAVMGALPALARRIWGDMLCDDAAGSNT